VSERKPPVGEDGAPGADDAARIDDALAWHVNGTISPDERLWLESKLPSNRQAQRELAFLREVKQALDAQAESVPAAIGYERLMRRVRSDPLGEAPAQPSRRTAPPPPSPLRRRLDALLSVLARPQMAMALGVLVLLQTALIGALVQRSTEPEPIYRSLGAPPPETLRVMFVDTLTERQLRDALQAHDAQIVHGPNAFGEYWIRSDTLPPDALENGLRARGVLASAARERVAPGNR